MNNKRKTVCGFLDHVLANTHGRGTKSVFFKLYVSIELAT